MRVPVYCFFMLLCTACHGPGTDQDKPFAIRLSADSQSIYIRGIPYATLQELKMQSLTGESWQAIFPVYRMPADSDMKDLQKEQPGKYVLTDSSIIFKPDTSFQKHRQYFARFYGSHTALTYSQLIRSKANLQGPRFIEVVFKF